MALQVQWFDETDERPYNINNLPPRPDDYNSVNNDYGLDRWKSIHPLNPKEIKLRPADFNMLLEKTTARFLTHRPFAQDDLDDFSTSLVNEIDAICGSVPEGVFVKMTYKSAKKSFCEGPQRPLKSSFEILSRLTSTRDLFQHAQEPNQSLYLCPWVDIDPCREYRVFYIDGKLVAISQQACYHSFHFDGREEQVLADAQKILDYPFNLYRTATLDMAIVDERAFLIECNPPSLHYGAGSALFREDDFKTFDGKTIPVRIR